MVVVHRLSFSVGCGICFPTGDGSRVPCIARQNFNHWTTREVPGLLFEECTPARPVSLSCHLGLLSDQRETQGGLAGRRGAHCSSRCSLLPFLLVSASGDRAPGPRRSSLAAALFCLERLGKQSGSPLT